MRKMKDCCKILVVIIVLALFAGCKEETVESSFKTLSLMQITEIESVWSGPCPNLTSAEVYYGTHNGYIAIFFRGDVCMAETRTIAGVEISHGYPFYIYLYKDGVLTELEDAYHKGMISKAVVEAIAEYHKKPGKSHTFISFFKVNYDNINEIIVTNRITDEVVAQITDTGDIKMIRNTFIGWDYEAAKTEEADLACMYRVTFVTASEKMEIEFSESSTYCRIDNEPYLLPKAFHRTIVQYITESEHSS